jgi:hypothetical protein
MSGIHENKFVTNFDARAVREDREVRQTSHFLYESSTHLKDILCESSGSTGWQDRQTVCKHGRSSPGGIELVHSRHSLTSIASPLLRLY